MNETDGNARLSLALEVDGLEKSYYNPGREPFHAVCGISFSIAPGECFGLLGPNGAGKSTSMNCIVGFYPTTRGNVRLMGVDVHADPKRARLHLGVCSQDDTLDTDFTVFDQMVLYATYFGIRRGEGEARAAELLRRFGLESKASEPVEALSGGLRRRLQVARSLVADPKVLVLDEPTTGLDPDARHIVWDIIRGFREAGGAVLLSTHYMEEAQRLCDRIAILHRGHILDCASPQTLIDRHIGTQMIDEELRPGVKWKRPPNVEDVFLKLTGKHLEDDEREGE
ncbi:MAG: ABC transporter ATP-binding protein [Candidatus Riflebacteria bacterium]|nr:ABC transporter ATP-binding protein [Candidatus Riflebacteria bacterium]